LGYEEGGVRPWANLKNGAIGRVGSHFAVPAKAAIHDKA
jgi:hypothetical protein